MSRTKTFILLSAAFVVVMSSPKVHAAPVAMKGSSRLFIVNDNRDLPDLAPDGVCQVEFGMHACTLRAALDEINAIGGGPHHVRIGSMVIRLSMLYGRLTVNPGVTVSLWGAGAARSTVDGGGPSPGVQIFAVSAGATLNIRDLTLANGVASSFGGAIQNAGDVYIAASVLAGNRATASGIVGDPGRGGAIFNQPGGRLTVAGSTLSNNESRGSGGAIRNEGSLLVIDSTLSGNDGFAGGGGALANNGVAFIVTSTLSGNHSAGAGAIWNDAAGRLSASSVTLADNYTHTGGPWNTIQNSPGGLVWMANTLVSSGQPGTNCVGALTSLGFNLSNDASCGLQSPGDWQGIEAGLGLLEDNGGSTQTHALLPGSYAIDKGFCVRGSDQRGFRRPVDILGVVNAGNHCDIGAFEVQRAHAR